LTVYLDTSVVVSLLTLEPRTRDVRAWMMDRAGEGFVISDWVVTEFSSALAVKVRTGQLSRTECAVSMGAFTGMMESMTVLSVTRPQFRLAARFCDMSDQGLRSPDALHLGICSDQGMTLGTLDRKLSEIGLSFGVPTLLL
jgi:predicted nucleic acid-binding protein